jgi:deoxyribodipyrimidine photo-lyase
MPSPRTPFPALRLRPLNTAAVNRRGRYVLYWMTAARRTVWNFALQRATDWGRELDRPLLVFEALRSDYPWASDRLHSFVIEGMVDNQASCAERGVGYFPYLEPEPGAGRGLLQHLAEQAAVVVTDDFPCFFLPRMTQAAAQRLDVLVEAVDGNGLLPLRAADRVFATAHAFRRFLQQRLRPHLDQFPLPDPLAVPLVTFTQLPRQTHSRWPAAKLPLYLGAPARLHEFPIDHQVRVSPLRGGPVAAEERLETFVRRRLSRYGTQRNHPDQDATSGLSPYLHFGHVAPHQVFDRVMRHAGWSTNRLAAKASGSRQGWWGVGEEVEAFLDELITWRELGYNICWQRDDYDQYSSLPDWARKTLEDHLRDRRDPVYSLAQFEAAETHDKLWNAAQRELVREGRMHNYLRMLWGKKILHWSRSPQEALRIMIELNNKYALDGRDPNSYSGIFWVLGRYDRAWGPERKIFGKIRYMSSENTARKLQLAEYLRQHAPPLSG